MSDKYGKGGWDHKREQLDRIERKEEHRIVIEDGEAKFIYTDSLAALAKEGTVVRASHVEFDNVQKGWVADMSPSGGGMLGPFGTREEALAAEREWLRKERGL